METEEERSARFNDLAGLQRLDVCDSDGENWAHGMPTAVALNLVANEPEHLRVRKLEALLAIRAHYKPAFIAEVAEVIIKTDLDSAPSRWRVDEHLMRVTKPAKKWNQLTKTEKKHLMDKIVTEHKNFEAIYCMSAYRLRKSLAAALSIIAKGYFQLLMIPAHGRGIPSKQLARLSWRTSAQAAARMANCQIFDRVARVEENEFEDFYAGAATDQVKFPSSTTEWRIVIGSCYYSVNTSPQLDPRGIDDNGEEDDDDRDPFSSVDIVDQNQNQIELKVEQTNKDDMIISENNSDAEDQQNTGAMLAKRIAAVEGVANKLFPDRRPMGNKSVSPYTTDPRDKNRIELLRKALDMPHNTAERTDIILQRFVKFRIINGTDAQIGIMVFHDSSCEEIAQQWHLLDATMEKQVTKHNTKAHNALANAISSEGTDWNAFGDAINLSLKTVLDHQKYERGYAWAIERILQRRRDAQLLEKYSERVLQDMNLIINNYITNLDGVDVGDAEASTGLKMDAFKAEEDHFAVADRKFARFEPSTGATVQRHQETAFNEREREQDNLSDTSRHSMDNTSSGRRQKIPTEFRDRGIATNANMEVSSNDIRRQPPDGISAYTRWPRSAQGQIVHNQLSRQRAVSEEFHAFMAKERQKSRK